MKIAAVVIGLFVVGLSYLSYKGWIDVRWMEMENAAQTALSNVTGQAVHVLNNIVSQFAAHSTPVEAVALPVAACILISLVTIVAAQSVFAATISDNKTSGSNFANMTFVGNMMPRRNMTMPGGNMTFGSSLQNAKMHLTEAIMDLKSGNTKGAAMEMNQTAQSIRLHEQELKMN